MNSILAISGENEEEYNKRIKDNKLKECLHNYDGQDNLKLQFCRFCCCLRHNMYINKNYNIYFDDYL